MQRQVIIAGWRMPQLSLQQKQEFTVLAQAAAGGTKPAIIEGAWSAITPRVTADLFSLEVAVNHAAQPGLQARAYRQAQRAEASRSKLSETQRSRRDATVALKRDAEVSARLDVDCMVGKGGAWADLCWWRNPRDWLPELSEDQQGTGARMMRWGAIPKSMEHLLIFVGMERDARRVFCNRTGAAIR